MKADYVKRKLERGQLARVQTGSTLPPPNPYTYGRPLPYEDVVPPMLATSPEAEVAGDTVETVIAR